MGPSDAVPTGKIAICVALADKLDSLTGFFAVGEKPTGSGDPFALRRAALGVIRILLENYLRLPLNVSDELLSFFADRLKVALREKGVRHDLIDAVFALTHEDELVQLVARVEALQACLKTDDGVNLLAGYKRAANILRDEEKTDKKTFTGEVTSEAAGRTSGNDSRRRALKDQGRNRARPGGRRLCWRHASHGGFAWPGGCF